MTTSDYLINAAFVLVVLRQARERRLDVRGLVVPLAVVLFVAHLYVHSIPSSGNDLALVGVLAAVGLTLGLVSGLATHVRLGGDGVPLTRVGLLAGGLLVAGICARMVFALAVTNGAEPAIRSPSWWASSPPMPTTRRLAPSRSHSARFSRGGWSTTRWGNATNAAASRSEPSRSPVSVTKLQTSMPV